MVGLWGCGVVGLWSCEGRGLRLVGNYIEVTFHKLVFFSAHLVNCCNEALAIRACLVAMVPFRIVPLYDKRQSVI